MSDNLTGVLIVLICVLGPIWLTMHYRARGQRGAALNAADTAALANAMQTAQRLEQRVVTLERILDADAPAWRNNMELGGVHGRQAG